MKKTRLKPNNHRATQPPKRNKPSEPPRERLTKLAKENGITNDEEHEIREAFDLFAEPLSPPPEAAPKGRGKSKPELVMPTKDVRRALYALGLPPSDKDELDEFLSILDPEDEGFCSYEPFLAIAALKMHQREDEEEDGEGETRKEVVDAFQLFVGEAGGDVLTLGHLKRVCMTLKQEVDEALLRDMIDEANGGKGVGKGVRLEEFEGLMRRLGMLK